MTTYLVAILCALTGAILQELSHWYQLRAKLSEKQYQKLMDSRAYWIVTAIMVLATPLGVLIWYHDSLVSQQPRDFLVYGAAFPLIFKSGVAAATATNNQVVLGAGHGPLGQYFGKSP